MYSQHFGLKHEPFSIAPDPRYLFMSERHREALAHLLYGLGGGGGFVLLSGEIGAGKTTVCRCFLEQIPKRCNVAYIFNPKLTVVELLRSVCEEFRIPFVHAGPQPATVKDYLDPLNEFLLRTHAVGQNNVLIIDEAQMLSAEVLEQLRLLTNLETNERKLLQIILIGQPELRTLLARPELEQLAQRVIARFHLDALSAAETTQYIRHRLSVAGLSGAVPFRSEALERIHQLSRGVPRRINLLCDRALLGAYALGKSRVDRNMVDKAAGEVFDTAQPAARPLSNTGRAMLVGGGLLAGAASIGALAWAMGGLGRATPVAATVAGSSVARAASAAASQVAVARPAPAASVVAITAAVAAKAASAAGALRDSTGLPALTAAELRLRFPAVITNEKDAWRELAPAWNIALGEGDPCAQAQRQQVQCFKSASSNLALIRQLGRPGVLTLRDEQGRPVYVLLTALSAQGATLRMGAVSHNVSLASLAQLWQGDFATLWRAPAGYQSRLVDGSSGPVVDALAAQLAALRGEPAPVGKAQVNEPLRAAVRSFQLAQGLKADGVAGATTFMQLNRASGVDEPRLPAELAAH